MLWDKCGMARNAAGLREALERIPQLREEFWSNVNVPGTGRRFQSILERAGRVADFLEFGELMCLDALDARRIVRRPFSRRTSNARRRSDARRRKFRRGFRLGISGKWQTRRAEIASRAAHFETVQLTQRSYK